MLDMRLLTMLLVIYLLPSSCVPDEKANHEKQPSYSPPSFSKAYADSLPELTPKQQSSFDALNALQKNTDVKNRLYSTFANIVQPCYPPDTSFTISRSELLTAIKQFVIKHCTSLTIEERNELAASAVLAQEEYIVLYCPENSSNVNYDRGLPMTGTWVMPGVLGRRDVILVW